MSIIRMVAILGAAMLFLSSCSFFSGPDDEKLVGIVEWVDEGSSGLQSAVPQAMPSRSLVSVATDVLEVPDTVEAGASFDIIVRTWGPNACAVAAGGTSSQVERTVAITPYDKFRVGITCASSPVRLPRTFRASFPQPGQALIRVTGRAVTFDGEVKADENWVTVEKHVIVR